jgi:hypothetical protein
MRILRIGQYADLGDVDLRFSGQGHEIELFSSIAAAAISSPA